MRRVREVIPDHVAQTIVSIPIPDIGAKDRVIWGLTSDGNFSTKSAGWLAQGLLNYTPEISKFYWIWNLDLPPKIKNFIWKACVNGLPTKARLNQNHIGVSLDCIFSNSHIEDAIHIFFECPTLKTILIKVNAAISLDWDNLVLESSHLDYVDALS